MKALFFAILFILEITVVYSQAPWLLQSPLPTAQNLTRNYFLDANTGYVVGNNGTVIYTSNGGSLWEKRESGVTNLLLSVYFVSPTTGWCAGEGVIIKTTNGGINWQTQLSDPNLYVNSVYFINENKGWAAGRFGKVYSTENGGSS